MNNERLKTNITAVFHDMEKRRDNIGYRFKLHHSFPSLLSIHHTPQRIVQYPSPHSSFSISISLRQARTVLFVNRWIVVLPVVRKCSPPLPRDAAIHSTSVFQPSLNFFFRFFYFLSTLQNFWIWTI